jgi:hypothetical protein
METDKDKIRIIRKETLKDYFKTGFKGGLAMGIILFLVGLPSGFYNALMGGLCIWIAFIFIFSVIGFFGYEFFERKIQIKKLQSKKYKFLHDNSFIINENLFFEGIYKNFFIMVHPSTQWLNPRKKVEYVVIETYYNYSYPNDDVIKKEKEMSGEYIYGHFSFENGCVGFLPKDNQKPNFEKDFYGLLDICRRHGLIPVSKKEHDDIMRHDEPTDNSKTINESDL